MSDSARGDQIIAGPADRGLVDEVDEFLDLVCADPDLLRAEFDDLITSCWGASAPVQRPRYPRRWAEPPTTGNPLPPGTLGRVIQAPRPCQGGQRGPPGDD
jgi:hypothetical protein